MSQALSGTLKKTPLNARHRSLGARMVEYGGWDMPVEYSGIVLEHQADATLEPQRLHVGARCWHDMGQIVQETPQRWGGL